MMISGIMALSLLVLLLALARRGWRSRSTEAGSPTSPAHSTPAAGELAAVKSGCLDRALMEVAPSGGGGRVRILYFWKWG